MGRAKRVWLCGLIPLWEVDSSSLEVDWNRQEARAGDVVELRVRTLKLALNLQQPNFSLKFDILENDIWGDDHALTIRSEAGGEGEHRPIQALSAGQAPPEADRLKKIFVSPADKPGDHQIVAFWKAVRVDDVAGNPEYYFDVKLTLNEETYEERSDNELSIDEAVAAAPATGTGAPPAPAPKGAPELEKLFKEKKLDDRHIDDPVFRARLEQLDPAEGLTYLEKATGLRVLRYLYRLLDFLQRQAAFKAAPPGEREKITFILGAEVRDNGTRDDYYFTARNFFERNPAGTLVTDLRSLAEVRQHLDRHTPSNGRPWGEVNIVVHGNHDGGMGAAVAPGEKEVATYNLRPMVPSALLFEDDVINPEALLQALQDPARPVSVYLLGRMREGVRQKVKAYDGREIPSAELMFAVVDELNESLRFDRLYLKERFDGIQLSGTLQKQVETVLTPRELVEVNRELLTAAFPGTFKKVPSAQPSELHFDTLDDKVVDCRTLLRIRGCSIGQSADMLRLLSMSFGGTDYQRPQVCAPRHLQNYFTGSITRGGVNTVTEVEEYLSPFYFVAFPADAPPKPAALPSLFRAKYPDVKLNWERLAPAADTRQSPYTQQYSFNYRPIPPRKPERKNFKNDVAFKTALDKYQKAYTAQMKNYFDDSDQWVEIRERERLPRGDGSFEITFTDKREGGEFEYTIEVGPEPPQTEKERLAFLARKYGRRFQEGYSWKIKIKVTEDKGVREDTLTFSGRRTLRRIEVELQAQRLEKLTLPVALWESLKKAELSPAVRQAFESGNAPLSAEAAALLYMEQGEQVLLIDTGKVQSWVVTKSGEQVKVFLEETLPEGPPVAGAHHAHPPITDLRHFGVEIPVRPATVAFGQNVPPEPRA